MAKIIVYEDDTISLVGRYSELNKNHEVYVHLMGPFAKYLESEGLRNHLKEVGFDIEKVKSHLDSDWLNNPPEADIYFTDGLRGECFGLLEKLPKEKSFLYSSDSNLQKTAKKRGYKVVTKGLEEIIEKTLSE